MAATTQQQLTPEELQALLGNMGNFGFGALPSPTTAQSSSSSSSLSPSTASVIAQLLASSTPAASNVYTPTQGITDPALTGEGPSMTPTGQYAASLGIPASGPTAIWNPPARPSFNIPSIKGVPSFSATGNGLLQDMQSVESNPYGFTHYQTPSTGIAHNYAFVGPNYLANGEQPGYAYNPWTDKYTPIKTNENKLLQDEGVTPAPASQTSQLLNTLGQAGALGLGAAGGKGIESYIASLFNSGGGGSSGGVDPSLDAYLNQLSGNSGINLVTGSIPSFSYSGATDSLGGGIPFQTQGIDALNNAFDGNAGSGEILNLGTDAVEGNLPGLALTAAQSVPTLLNDTVNTGGSILDSIGSGLDKAGNAIKNIFSGW